MTLFVIIIELILVLVFFIVFLLVFLWMWSAFRTKEPFIPVPTSILKDIHTALGLNNQSVLYDLGCGDGRILLHESNFHLQAKYVGFEIASFPLLLSRIQIWWHNQRTNSKIEIRHQDFFTADISKATHVFTYLYPHVMDDLLKKLDRELKAGTRLVSVSYKFTTKQPAVTIDLKRSPYKLARTIYIYEF